MTPMPITFYLYAEDEREVRELEEALYQFVMGRYRKGVPVTAKGVGKALKTIADNPFIDRFIDGK